MGMDNLDDFSRWKKLAHEISTEFSKHQGGEELSESLVFPSMYEVLLLNDDRTPIDFISYVLRDFFYKTPEDASQQVLQIHRKGYTSCAIYTKDVAETKVAQVMDFITENSYSLRCIMKESRDHAVKKS